MDYKELRKYQRKEKNTANLVEIRKGFYEELKELVKQKQEKYQEEMDPKIKKELDNIRKIAKDLYKKRERKILSRAIKENPDDIREYNLTNKEKEIYKELRNAVQNGRDQLKQVLHLKKPNTTEETEKERKEKQEKTEEQNETVKIKEESESEGEKERAQDEDLNKVMVKILKEVPEFVSDNLKKLGPYKPDTEIKLPEQQAEILSEKGLAKKIESKKTQGDQDEDT